MKVKIGIIGVGHLGKIHLKLIKAIPSLELVGFYDINPETSAYVSQTYGVKSFTNRDALINAVDAIDIVTPTPTHFECAEAAVRAGKHIFVEKPVTFTIDEAEALMKLVSEAQIVAQVGHVERFNPAFLAVVEDLKKPLFIDTQRFAIFNTRGLDVSVVLDLMIHDLDIVLSTIKSPLKKISASGIAMITETVDMANARLEFLNGSVANLSVSRVAVENIRKARFFMHDKLINVDFLNKTSEKYSLANQSASSKGVWIPLEMDEQKRGIVIDKPKVVFNNAIEDELSVFADSIINQTTPTVSLEDAYNAVVVAHQILEKINNKL
ncbi:MAG: Gfo/Idh/MocA family oxidoreductase [Bacteroidales bacterium]|nr:Gfo/Idh/MocA family oxidoreductase [Bacteroidales bacterium]